MAPVSPPTSIGHWSLTLKTSRARFRRMSLKREALPRVSWPAGCRPRGFFRHRCDVRMVNEVHRAMPGEAEAGTALKEPLCATPHRDQPQQLKVPQVTVPRMHSVTCDLRRLRSNLPRNSLVWDAPKVLRVLRRCLPAEDSLKFVRARTHPHFGHRSHGVPG